MSIRERPRKSLDVEQIGVEPDVFVTWRDLEPPARWQSQIRLDFRPRHNEMLDVHRAEEPGVALVNPAAGPDVPAAIVAVHGVAEPVDWHDRQRSDTKLGSAAR